MSAERTYGLELEKAIADRSTGMLHAVGNDFFHRVAHRAVKRGQTPSFGFSDKRPDTILSVTTDDLGDQGLDNGYNLLETALPYTTEFEKLAEIAEADLDVTVDALKEEGASMVNLSIHPLGSTDEKTYKAFAAPKTLYDYLGARGWDHSAGIDAKAQNSPATGVSAHEAADAVSVMIGSGAAMVGLFANSPYAEGQRTPYKESRLMMWDRMLGGSPVKGDHRTAQFPPERFETLAQYFNWMHGGDSGIHFVLADNKGYKKVGDSLIVVEGNPSVLDYLAMPETQGRTLNDMLSGNNDHPISVVPDISHMETMQFAQFAGARVRYGLQHDGFPTARFLEACRRPDKRGVEDIFAQNANFVYIEGRDPGANFPDGELYESGDAIAQSTFMSPSAIQAGLIQNLDGAVSYLNGYHWQHLGALRDAAIRDGLQGEVDGVTVGKFADDILKIAAEGLQPEQERLLAYPEHVLRTGKNGADRAVDFAGDHPSQQTLQQLVKNREVTL